MIKKTHDPAWRLFGDTVTPAAVPGPASARGRIGAEAFGDVRLPLPKGFLQLHPPNARPPAHFGCRSVIVAIFDPDGIADKIGERPFVRTSKTRRMREKDFRRETRDQLGEDQWREMSGPERTAAISDRRRAWTRENVGQVASETTYGEWLKRQPAAFQDDVLGPARARMFRAGEETVHSFVDSRGKLLTIKQLKERRQSRKKG